MAQLIAHLRRLGSRLTSPSLDAILSRQRGHWSGGPTLVLSFDVEHRIDCLALPEVVSALAERGIVASFACIGAWVEAYPAEHRAVLDAGHELLNHTDRHPSHDELGDARPFDSLSDGELLGQIRAANTKLNALGANVMGFRSPHFGAQHTDRVYPLLRDLGLRYSTSTVASIQGKGGAPDRVDGVWELPVLACPEHPRSPLDSWHTTTAPDAAHPDARSLLRVYETLLRLLVRRRAFGSVYWDPHVLRHPGHAEVLDRIAARSGLRLTTYRELIGSADRDPSARWR